MSVTGHRPEIRHPDDFYATPAWCTRALLEHLTAEGLRINSVFDPSAGKGSILVAAADFLGGEEASLRGLELDDGRASEARARFLDVETADCLTTSWGSPRTVIMNPPYRQAAEHVGRALEQSPPGGLVCALLRLSWLAGIKRAPFHMRHPAHVAVLARRPSFTGKGTDATDYGWFVWGYLGHSWSILAPSVAASEATP